MVALENLVFSLTKNGYLKIGTLVFYHASREILKNVKGVHPGVNLEKSQVAQILGADANGVVPAFWDEIRKFDRDTIDNFVFLAILFSHHRLIELFKHAGEGKPRGVIARDDLTDKEFTNLHYAMGQLRLCEHEKSAVEFEYDLRPMIERLQPANQVVERLLRNKLLRCEWHDPREYMVGGDREFLAECCQQGFHTALGMKRGEFTGWVTGRPNQPR